MYFISELIVHIAANFSSYTRTWRWKEV